MDQIDMTVRVYPVEEVKTATVEALIPEIPREKPSFSQLVSEGSEEQQQEPDIQTERRGPGRPRKHPLTPALVA